MKIVIKVKEHKGMEKQAIDAVAECDERVTYINLWCIYEWSQKACRVKGRGNEIVIRNTEIIVIKA